MKWMFISILGLFLISGCANHNAVEYAKTKEVPTEVVKYLQQPDSLIKDSVITINDYDYQVSKKHITRIYYLDNDTGFLMLCICGVLLGFVIGLLIFLKP